MFEHGRVTAAAEPSSYEDWLDEQAARFDDTDGAYDIAEPDPFGDLSPEPLRHPSLRAELRSDSTGPLAELSRAAVPALPVHPGLAPVLPDGLRRGSTVAVTNSVSLLLALVGETSARGGWVALVGMPAISADAAAEAGIELSRLAVIDPGHAGWAPASWTTAVGALLDAVDLVVARPGAAGGYGSVAGSAAGRRAGGVSDGDARRLNARARGKDAVLVLFGQQAQHWPAVEVELSARHTRWDGIGEGYGRLTGRRLSVSASGKGRSARPRTTDLRLPLAMGTNVPVSGVGTVPTGISLPAAG